MRQQGRKNGGNCGEVTYMSRRAWCGDGVDVGSNARVVYRLLELMLRG